MGGTFGTTTFGTLTTNDFCTAASSSSIQCTTGFTGSGNVVLATSPIMTGPTVSSGGLTITAGGLTVSADGASITGTVTGTTFSGSGASLTNIGTTNMTSVTGTPSSTTYLRGDNTWGTPTVAYPGAGIANSTGSAWGTSYTTSGSGTVVALATSPVFTTPSLGSATASALTMSSITGSNQCLHVNSSGVVSGTGSDCAAGGGSGTVNSGTQYQMAYYPNSGSTTTVGGNSGIITDANNDLIVAPSASSTATTVRFSYTGAADTALTASTEASDIYFNMGQTRQHATDAIATQRDFRITGSNHSFVGASTITNAAALAIDGPPKAGTNATITNSSAIYIPTLALSGGTVTNSYGLNVAATTGGTRNYAAYFSGGNVGIGTATPASTLSVFGGGLAVGTYAGNTSVGVGSALFSGNVGIGTAAPVAPLNVVSQQQAAGTSTLAILQPTPAMQY